MITFVIFTQYSADDRLDRLDRDENININLNLVHLSHISRNSDGVTPSGALNTDGV